MAKKDFVPPDFIGTLNNSAIDEYLALSLNQRGQQANGNEPEGKASKPVPAGSVAEESVASETRSAELLPEAEASKQAFTLSDSEGLDSATSKGTEMEPGEIYKNLYISPGSSANPVPVVSTQQPQKKVSKAAVRAEQRIRLTGETAGELVNYLSQLPNVYQQGTFEKGETKVRISATMAAFLRLLTEQIPVSEQPKYLIDNLINELLREFILRFSNDFAALNECQLQREQALRQQQLMLLNQSANARPKS